MAKTKQGPLDFNAIVSEITDTRDRLSLILEGLQRGGISVHLSIAPPQAHVSTKRKGRHGGTMQAMISFLNVAKKAKTADIKAACEKAGVNFNSTSLSSRWFKKTGQRGNYSFQLSEEGLIRAGAV